MLQEDLDMNYEWSKAWKMKFNAINGVWDNSTKRVSVNYFMGIYEITRERKNYLGWFWIICYMRTH